MKKQKTAAEQLLQLIESLNLKNKMLNLKEYIQILEATKSISYHVPIIESTIQSIQNLQNTDINNKHKLSNREKQILLLIGKGQQSLTIANELNISKSTVETHRKNIRKKLKLNGNDNLFAFALIFSLQSQTKIRDDIFRN